MIHHPAICHLPNAGLKANPHLIDLPVKQGHFSRGGHLQAVNNE